MTAVYLDIGSNINRRENIQSCVDQLSQDFPDIRFSKAYESDAVGFDGDAFINLSACLETDLSYSKLKSYLKKLENRHSRKRNKTKFISRTLDVDILLFGDLILQPEHDVPREEILKFPFVLFPLAEIAADVIHPQHKMSISELVNSTDLDENTLTQILDFPKLSDVENVTS